jgi:hypothetical protein
VAGVTNTELRDLIRNQVLRKLSEVEQHLAVLNARTDHLEKCDRLHSQAEASGVAERGRIRERLGIVETATGIRDEHHREQIQDAMGQRRELGRTVQGHAVDIAKQGIVVAIVLAALKLGGAW